MSFKSSMLHTGYNIMETKEEWRDVFGYKEYYKVSNLGRVKKIGKTVFRNNGTRRKILDVILKNTLKRTGYTQVRLIVDDNLFKSVLVHRLVATAFIPNPENKPQVNHINGVKNDNRVENLEWVTASENGLHKYRVLGLVPSLKGKFGVFSNKRKAVNQLSMEGEFIKRWGCMSDATRQVSGHPQVSSIGLCCKGLQSHARGYKWEYAKK